MLRRKAFLKTVMILSAVTLAAVFNSAAFAERNVKHIILFVGDGMHLEHEIAASRYLFGRDFKLSFHRFPVETNVSTWDVTTYAYWSAQELYDPDKIRPQYGYSVTQGGQLPYPLQTAGISETYHTRVATDSASAATAWATGYKTDDGNIAWLPGDPADGALKTIAEILREENGMAVGVVSTVPFSHATPAAHASHNVNRNDYHGIAREMLTVVKPEVVIGGGHPTFYGRDRYIPQEIYENFRNGVYEGEYVFVERSRGVDGGQSVLTAARKASASGKKLFGLFGGSGGEFESPIPSDTPAAPAINRASIENPLLRDAALAAIEVVSKDPDGFFLMLEQGDIDWANHANDFARMIGTTWDLHNAVEAVIDFVNQEGDGINWGNTLLIVTSDHGNSYMRLNDAVPLGVGDLPRQVPTPLSDTPFVYPDKEVAYGSTGHTNELVRLYAKGKMAGLFKDLEGEWYPCSSIIDNTQIFQVMMKAAGLPAASPLTVITDDPRCPREARN